MRLADDSYAEYTYEHLGTGYCSDWINLPGPESYPPRLQPSDALYDADPRQECLNRCLDVHGQDGSKTSTVGGTIGNKAFYLKSDGRCACAIKDCSSLKTSESYESYEIIQGNRWV